jgi:hypothetical protein
MARDREYRAREIAHAAEKSPVENDWRCASTLHLVRTRREIGIRCDPLVK